MKPTTWLFHALLMLLLSISPAFATSFQTVSTSTTDLPPFSPYGAAFGNFSNSSRQDMAVTISDGSSNHVRIMHGDGVGGFSSYWQLDAAADPRSIVAADLNMDGKMDLAVSNFGNNSVSVFIGNGDGTFQARADYTVGSGPTSIAVGDFKGNGIRNDIAVINSSSNSVAILINNGSGIMTVQNSSDWPTTTDAPAGIAVGDFNGDDIVDIAVGRSSAGAVRIFKGSGATGKFLAGIDITVGTIPVAMASADFDNDGLCDLAVVNNGSDNISIIRGNANSSFSVNNYDVYSPPDAGANPVAISAGDFNRDGIIDLAVANNGLGTISVLRGVGNATFMTPEIFTTGPAPTAIAYGDLNGSGNDLGTLSISNQSYSLLLNNSTAVAGITVTPVNHYFGKLPDGTLTVVVRYQTLTIANNGSADLGISSMQKSGTDSGYFDFYTGGPMPCTNAPLTIPANKSCTMQIKAAGTGGSGIKYAAIDIMSNATNRTTLAIPISAEFIPKPDTATLTLSIIGRGTGFVEFSPTYSVCPPNCTSTQPFGAVNITPYPDTGMYFYGWTGCDYISSSGCFINPATDRNITANFGVLPRRVKLGVSLPIYTSTVSAAYASSEGNEVILAQTGLLDENLVMGRDVNIMLKGGLDSVFINQGAPTILRSLTVAAGSAVIDNIMLQ